MFETKTKAQGFLKYDVICVFISQYRIAKKTKTYVSIVLSIYVIIFRFVL